MHEAGEKALHEYNIANAAIHCSQPLPNAIISYPKFNYCPKVCSSAQSLAGHMSRIHKVKHISRTFAHSSGTCSICMKSFHSCPRLIHHLRQGSYRRLMQYDAYNLLLSPEDVIEFDSLDGSAAVLAKRSGQSALHANSLPVVQSFGPLRPLIISCLTSMHDVLTVINAVPQKRPAEVNRAQVK